VLAMMHSLQFLPLLGILGRSGYGFVMSGTSIHTKGFLNAKSLHSKLLVRRAPHCRCLCSKIQSLDWKKKNRTSLLGLKGFGVYTKLTQNLLLGKFLFKSERGHS